MKLLVTGAAGFIGFHTSKRLLEDGHEVTGLDNLNSYYDVRLKEDRLSLLKRSPRFSFVRENLENRSPLENLFENGNFDRVVHLGAQAGVRHSLTHPHDYIDSNVTGFLNILEGCRHHKVSHLVFASSSSVYGLNSHMPFAVNQGTNHPLALYGATKKANELMAHSYAHLFRMPVSGLRFFTAYGPWGRPDMALFIFTKNILEGKPIDVYNKGEMTRDFTYIDDIVEGILRVTQKPAEPDPDWDSDAPDPSTSSAPYRIYNIGCSNPVPLMKFIEELEKNLGRKATINYLPMQPGDIPKNHADVSDLKKQFDYSPKRDVSYGIQQFVAWYLDYYKGKNS
ncbi:MAG: NAD-dependent epimerase [Candidatus Nitronauta litoralis]|uniref:NAD-dependent epimerase n=1 Tax=Candidatus Nitronauta litoralis TaxID=2705533 RepID=A0A7T0BWH0_9BACT|nr:MAG: NAD-dependent epimerase [Candidatus Nitronauta litoralis]